MEKLNLPSFQYRFREENDIVHIFDIIRKKHVVLTPEEWVRQHFVHLMIDHFKYPKSLIKLESGHSYNDLKKRTDIIVYDRNGEPFLLVECKAPSVKLTDKTFQQVSTYNQTIKAPHIVITNGLKTLCCAIDFEKNAISYLETLPEFSS